MKKTLLGIFLFSSFPLSPFLFGSSLFASAAPQTAPVSPAEGFVFVGWENAPFYFKESSHGIQGALHEIVAEMCRLRNWKCIFRIMNFREAIVAIRSGQAQVGGPFVFTSPRNTVFYFSDRIFSSSYAFFGLEKNTTAVKSYDSLRGLGVGVISPSGASISLAAVAELEDGKVNVIAEKNLGSLLKQVENGRYPLAYASRDSARVWINTNHSPLKEVNNLGEELAYRLIFSRVGVSEENFEKTNSTLEQLRKSGFLRLVAAKYKLVLAESEGRKP